MSSGLSQYLIIIIGGILLPLLRLKISGVDLKQKKSICNLFMYFTVYFNVGISCYYCKWL